MATRTTPLDHARLGRELGIFTTSELVGSGLPLWLPDGACVRRLVEELIVELERDAGYRHVVTPQLGKRELYERSGHWDFFADEMFPPMRLGEEELVLRPVNCPHHVLVYASAQRSYRDLPYRIAELGTMYRNERSGVIGGLSRVRAMTLNDAHVFCRFEQVADEVDRVLDLIERAYAPLGIEPAAIRLARRTAGGKWAGAPEDWQRSEAALKQALAHRGLAYDDAPGEAAFYGPKIDVEVADARGRLLTLSTVQVDLWMPGRFELAYAGADGADHRPVMVHRAVLSTAERLVGHLLERHQGAWPFWLAPRQVALLPVTEDEHASAAALAEDLHRAGVRAEVERADATLGARIRAAEQTRVPVVGVLGAREAADGSVAVRLRGGARSDGVDRARLVAACRDATDGRRSQVAL